MLVAMLDQQPVGALAAGPVMFHAHQHKTAMQPLPFERELEIALLERLFWRKVAFRLPISPVPELHCSPAILPLRDRTFEVAVIERVILDLNGKSLVLRVERGTAGDSP